MFARMPEGEFIPVCIHKHALSLTSLLLQSESTGGSTRADVGHTQDVRTCAG
jgi:hypothetical protein